MRYLSLLLCVLSGFVYSDTLNIIAWNVQSGHNDPKTIAREITEFEGYDIWGFSEVKADNANRYAQAVAKNETADYVSVLGSTGAGDRLQFVYNQDRLELIGNKIELKPMALQTGRAPLGGRFRLRSTRQEFIFLVNHIFRGNASKRVKQSQMLRDWVADQKLPVIVAGDFNYDYEIPYGPGNSGFDTFLADGIMEWVRPSKLIKTNAHPAYNDVLDFVFVNEAALRWQPESSIIVRKGDFPDNKKKSDHRPVDASFETQPEYLDVMLALN